MTPCDHLSALQVYLDSARALVKSITTMEPAAAHIASIAEERLAQVAEHVREAREGLEARKTLKASK
jgi:hypothetical protein